MPSKAGTSEILETAATFRTSLTESPELRNLLEPIGTSETFETAEIFPNLANGISGKPRNLPEPVETRNQATFRTSGTGNFGRSTSQNLRNRPGNLSGNPVPSQNRSSPRTHRNHLKSILRKKPIAFCCWKTALGGNVKTKGWDRETDKRQTDRHILSYGGIKNAGLGSFGDGSRKGCDT